MTSPLAMRFTNGAWNRIRRPRYRRGGSGETAGHLSRSLAEREAVIERQRREIEALRAQLALLEETGMAIRTSGVR